MPFTSLPALGNRGNSNSGGHVFTIPSINSTEDHRLPPAVGSRFPLVPGYGALSSHLPNSIYSTLNLDLSTQNQGQSTGQKAQDPGQSEGKNQSSVQTNVANPGHNSAQPQNSSQVAPPNAPHNPSPNPPQNSSQNPAQNASNLLLLPNKNDSKLRSQAPEAVSEKESSEPARSIPAIPLGVLSRSSTSNAYRPLNVKDALSYLDQVKIQFYNQADIYNNFLDIMKDFKSQSIDTPGVINRVSSLFRGHPNLIQGFNTFLPPGYKIECSSDPSDPNPITVTTPTGTTTRPNLAGTPPGEMSGTHQLYNQPAQNGAQFQDQQQVGGGQIEFNHAISYVNKIKTRFANQPDIYKQFLEILQTYQREQKPIGEVYEQVTRLFSNSPDLLNDFKQFLPDTGNHQPLQFLVRPEDQQVLPSNGHPHMHENQQFYPVNGTSQLPPLGNFQPNTSGAMNAQDVNYRNNRVPMMNPDVDHEAFRKNSEQHSPYQNNYNEEATYSSIRATGTLGKQKSVTPVPAQAAKVNPTLVPGIPEPVPPSYMAKSSSLLEELSFFDKVKKAIGNKQTYGEFLKMLNLFSQDVIDKDTLVQRVECFLGENHSDLLYWFKQFVGYEEKTQSMEDITFKKHQIELSLCKAHGPSYRQLPKIETYMPCSGRDEMCWEVLNDEWVGHPTWASEDAGFISHRKNQYEDILFKIEEERLEFDYHMEANLRTIQTLETIANRIANMTPEQKASFKLPPGLGHTSQTIYKKVIRKIYDKDRGFEVIDALHENPAVAVPVVLKRLKQKDEEWKRAQREWNKVWREMEQKVFYKSLDHLGLTFKQADKKLLTAKQLVSEISTVKVEQQNKRLHPLMPKSQEQLDYEFHDYDVIYDIIKLSEYFINHSSNYSQGDRERLCDFFKHFIGVFFGIDQAVIDTALKKRAHDSNREEKAGEGENNSDDKGQAQVKRGRENDLLRDVLKKQSTKSRREEVDDTPTSESEETFTSTMDGSGDLWISTSSSTFSLGETEQEESRHKFNLFCNTTVYVFFRHFRTLYERLSEIKGMDEEVGKEIKSRKIPQFAKDLNLVSQQLQEMNIEIVAGPKGCYSQVVALAERLLDGEIEHQWYEESLRQAYRNKAYKCYTLDKVVQSLVKHMHTLITDHKTSEMLVLFEQDRKSPSTTAKKQILYRMQVRLLMSTDENMFKIAYVQGSNRVNIQFVGLDDLTINDHANAEERYNYYVTSYVMSHPTEGVPLAKISMPFHKPFVDMVNEDQCNGRAVPKLKMSICENSFRMFFESGTFDLFTSNSVYVKRKDSTEEKEGLEHILNDTSAPWNASMAEESIKKLNASFDELIKNGVSSYKAEQPQKQDRRNPDATIDADSTLVLAEHNDTTIQQEANDSTMEEIAVNENGDK